MRILAVDYGDARTGLELMASPAGVIQERRMERTVEQVAAAARELRAEEIVVGHPINMNGTLGPRSQLCQEFARLVGEAAGLPVRLWDERGTTVSAHGFLNQTNTRGKKRKEVVDRLAAEIILQGYLDSLK